MASPRFRKVRIVVNGLQRVAGARLKPLDDAAKHFRAGSLGNGVGEADPATAAAARLLAELLNDFPQLLGGGVTRHNNRCGRAGAWLPPVCPAPFVPPRPEARGPAPVIPPQVI